MRIKFKRSGNNFTSFGKTLSEELEAALCHFWRFAQLTSTIVINISNFEKEQNLVTFQTVVEVQPSLTFVIQLAIGGLFEENVHHRLILHTT